MPAWNEYKKEAKDRGSLAFELFVVESTPVAPPEKLRAVLPDHLAYQRKQEEEGALFLAGPLSDPTGDQMLGTGMIIYRASSLAEATAITENDPMHAKGIRTFKIRKWLVNEGALTLNISLSNQKVEVV
ncbi:MAG: YciI family protein [Pseudomonadota bacterium]